LRLTTISMTGTSNKDKASTLLPPFYKKEPERIRPRFGMSEYRKKGVVFQKKETT